MTNAFTFTKPISWNYLNLVNEDYGRYLAEAFKNATELVKQPDKKIKKTLQISLIPDEFNEYLYTKFGIMEKCLDDMSQIYINENGEIKKNGT